MIKDKEFLSFAKAGTLLGISRQAVYKMVAAGHLKASKISSRLSFIKRSDIESMLKIDPMKHGRLKQLSLSPSSTPQPKSKRNTM